MDDDKIVIIEMTPFIFEDGESYYFAIYKRSSSNLFHDLYVYKKVKKEVRKLFKTVVIEEYKQLNKSPELITVDLLTNEIKSSISTIIKSTKAMYKLKNWDGFVGNIPEDVKQTILRDNKLKSILDK